MDSLIKQIGEYKKRTPVLIDNQKNSPIIPAFSMKDIAHLLRQRDIPNVRAVLEFLAESNAQAYIARSVVRNWLFAGERNYNDIDLLSVTQNESDRLAVLRYVTSKGTQDSLVEIGGRSFNYQRDFSRAYLDIHTEEKVTLSPVRLPCGRKGRSIDLCILSQESFDQQLGK
jgi:hypothetical protein